MIFRCLTRYSPACILLILLMMTGCVERKLKLRTDPPGALVTVNDEEVGVTPLEVTFLWYGDYDLIFRKTGYQTLKTNYRANPPWWQIPPFDLVTETMIATTLRDEHEPPVFALEPAEEPTVTDLVDRAVELRNRALFNVP